MNSSQPCTGYWPYTIAISPRKQCSTSCNSITPISRSGLRMRPHRYQGALRSWNAFMSANNKTWSVAASTNDVTRIGVMQGTVASNACSTHRGKTSLGDGEVEEGCAAMTLTHAYEEMTPEKRPQGPHMDGTGLRFKTLDHGGEYPDTMPQAIKLTDAQGRSCIYVPITQNGKVVNSQGFVFDPEDE